MVVVLPAYPPLPLPHPRLSHSLLNIDYVFAGPAARAALRDAFQIQLKNARELVNLARTPDNTPVVADANTLEHAKKTFAHLLQMQVFVYIYIYIYICVCVCVCVYLTHVFIYLFIFLKKKKETCVLHL